MDQLSRSHPRCQRGPASDSSSCCCRILQAGWNCGRQGLPCPQPCLLCCHCIVLVMDQGQQAAHCVNHCALVHCQRCCLPVAAFAERMSNMCHELMIENLTDLLSTGHLCTLLFLQAVLQQISRPLCNILQDIMTSSQPGPFSPLAMPNRTESDIPQLL